MVCWVYEYMPSFSVNSLQPHLLLFDVIVKVPGAGVNWLLQLHDDELGWSGLIGVGAVDVAAGVDGGDCSGLLSVDVVIVGAVQKSVEENEKFSYVIVYDDFIDLLLTTSKLYLFRRTENFV